jgi:hypothetical protein
VTVARRGRPGFVANPADVVAAAWGCRARRIFCSRSQLVGINYDRLGVALRCSRATAARLVRRLGGAGEVLRQAAAGLKKPGRP